ncbi:hypothetical protein DBV15_05250 [Temnothorax longispinosus]|uniref:Fatty acyl-CoA reductase n=1 Tax=Temnothorax longispinosus TaxID=300112 RepID=A0A4S2KRD5_9HYME|nr:hypothetical protein DBV15_05250 [Temnothorax longispinosus]
MEVMGADKKKVMFMELEDEDDKADVIRRSDEIWRRWEIGVDEKLTMEERAYRHKLVRKDRKEDQRVEGIVEEIRREAKEVAEEEARGREGKGRLYPVKGRITITTTTIYYSLCILNFAPRRAATVRQPAGNKVRQPVDNKVQRSLAAKVRQPAGNKIYANNHRQQKSGNLPVTKFDNRRQQQSGNPPETKSDNCQQQQSGDPPKLLRSYPDILTMYLLIRPKKDKCPKSRLDEMFEKPLFDRVKKEVPNFRKKIVPIIGDLDIEDFGLSENDKNILINQVSIIFHITARMVQRKHKNFYDNKR